MRIGSSAGRSGRILNARSTSPVRHLRPPWPAQPAKPGVRSRKAATAPRSRQAAPSMSHRRCGRRLHKVAARSRTADCSAMRLSRLLGRTRHFASGLRRQVPVPVQGASTSTTSAWPHVGSGSSSLPLGRGPGRCGRRRASGGRRSARGGACRCRSQRSGPVVHLGRQASDLPPAPAQRSTTCMPGSAAARMAASCEPSSWTSTSPSEGGSDWTLGARAFSRTRCAARGRIRRLRDAKVGELGHGLLAAAFRVLTRMSTGRGRRAPSSAPGPRRKAGEWPVEPFRIVARDPGGAHPGWGVSAGRSSSVRGSGRSVRQ